MVVSVVSKKEVERRNIENVFDNYKKYSFCRLTIELKEENKFIGFKGLKYQDDKDELELEYKFIKKYWCKGIVLKQEKHV